MPLIKPDNNIVNDEKFIKENNLNWKENFYFIQAADTQYGLIRRWDYIEEAAKKGPIKGWIDGPIKEWEREKHLSKETVRLVSELSPKPEFFIICGDMLDQFPMKIDKRFEDCTMTNELDEFRKAQYKDFLDAFKDLNVPLICICGNHDLGDKMTSESVKQYRSEFGDTYFKFYFNGVLFICLNSQLYFDTNGMDKLYKEQEKWLDEILLESKNYKHTIILQHHPLFLKTIDEKNDYFNLPIERREYLVNKFIDAGVTHVFSGHLHRNNISKYLNLENVTTGAIGLNIESDFKKGENNHGIRIVKVEEDQIKHRYYNLLNEKSKLLDF